MPTAADGRWLTAAPRVRACAPWKPSISRAEGRGRASERRRLRSRARTPGAAGIGGCGSFPSPGPSRPR
jgi:hypothetical protein